MRRRIASSVSAVAVVLLLPASAAADWLLTPYVGPTFETTAGGFGVGNLLGGGQPMTVGGSMGVVGSGLGVELDLGYTPRFFEGDSFLQNVVQTGVTTIMVNGLVGVSGRASGPGLRPYGSGGLGWIRSEVGDPFGLVSVGRTKPAFNAGGGLIAFVSDQVGIRGEVRYFRTFGEGDGGVIDSILNDLSFWRGTVGIAFRF